MMGRRSATTTVGRGLLLVHCLMGGCGYSLIGTERGIPANVRSLYVHIQPSERSDPVLADALARELRRLVRREGRFHIVSDSKVADAVLRVGLLASDTLPVAFDRYDDVLDYETTIRVDAVLLARDGNTLWAQQGISATRAHAAVAGAVVTSSSEFQSAERLTPGVLGQFDAVQLGEQRQEQAERRLVGDLADAIYGFMVEGR